MARVGFRIQIREHIHEVGPFRPGSDQRHIASQNIHYLGQLVQLEARGKLPKRVIRAWSAAHSVVSIRLSAIRMVRNFNISKGRLPLVIRR